MKKAILLVAALAGSHAAYAQTFFTSFDNITSAQVVSNATITGSAVGTFSAGFGSGYVTGDVGAQQFSGGDRAVLISNIGTDRTFSLNFSLTAPAASIDYSFWVSSNANFNGSAIVLVTGPSGYSQSATAAGFGTATAQNPGPGGSFHSGSLAGGSIGAYTITFKNASGNNGMRIDDVTVSTTPVPEPASIALMLGGLGVVSFVARRRKLA